VIGYVGRERPPSTEDPVTLDKATSKVD